MYGLRKEECINKHENHFIAIRIFQITLQGSKHFFSLISKFYGFLNFFKSLAFQMKVIQIIIERNVFVCITISVRNDP